MMIGAFSKLRGLRSQVEANRSETGWVDSLPVKLIHALAFFVAAVFFAAAVLKLLYFQTFVYEMFRISPLPIWMLTPFSIVLIMGEIFTAILLVWSRYQLLGSALGAGFLVLFILVASSFILEGKEFRCGCFGPFLDRSGEILILQNTILLLFCLTIYFHRKRKGQALTASSM
jgi:predicted secreted protein